MSMMRGLAASGDLEKLTRYLDVYDDKRASAVTASYCKHYTANILLSMYSALAKRQDTDFQVMAAIPEAIPVDDVDLCVILGNLLENALEASARISREQRQITVRIGLDLNRLGIFVENGFNGDLRVVNGRFYSSKQQNREGVGLASVQAAAARYGGSAEFYGDDMSRFHSDVILPARCGISNGEGNA
jgi:sensor histidine kinase regulating citrate/malate metabolism